MEENNGTFEAVQPAKKKKKKKPKQAFQGATHNKKPDMVNHPAHYSAGKIECIDALAEVAQGKDPFIAYCCCNAVKYLWRAGVKKGDSEFGQTQKEKMTEDIEKAIWYLNRAVVSLKK